MKNKHRTDATAHHPARQLKPLVIAVSAALGMSGLLTACNNNDANLILGVVGTLSVNATGGKGGTATGTGGGGGNIQLYAGGDNSSIVVLAGGLDLVPDVTDWPSAPSLGSNSHSFSSDATLDVYPVDLAGMFTGGTPAMYEAYQVDGDCNVYINSDGDAYGGNEPAVTGIEVGAGATLTLSGTGGGACIDLSNDLANSGGITAGAGGTINLYVEDYFGFAGSSVDSAGDAATPDGGDILIIARTSNYNAGDITSKGYSSGTGDGGNGRPIFLKGLGADLWNSGKLDSSGGDSSAAGYGGGDSGPVFLGGDDNASGGGTVISAGEIDSSGGDGPAGGGDGGAVFLYNHGAGEIFVTAGINPAGGNTTGTDGVGGRSGDIYASTSEPNSKIVFAGFRDITTTGGDGAGYGGDGGVVLFDPPTGQGSIKHVNEAAIDARGGDATLNTGSGYGGHGGVVNLYNSGDGFLSNSGTIDTSGGNAASGDGGGAGVIQFGFQNGHGVIINTADLTANGGDGTDGGGNSGIVVMQVSGGGSTGSGSIDNSGDITNRGGNATTGDAGGSGVVQFEMGNQIDGDVTNSGIIDSSGGNSTGGAGGTGGVVVVISDSNGGPGDITNSAAITINGGSGAYGGDGGVMDFRNTPATVGNDLGNDAPLSAMGGAGTVSGGRGGVVLFDADTVTNDSTIDTSGGNGGAGYGGDGGVINLFGDTGDVANKGNLTNRGGNATTGDGGDGGVVQLALGNNFSPPIDGDVTNSGLIDTSGGNSASGGTGGRGGVVDIAIHAPNGGSGDVTNSAAITTNGGSGAYGGDGGVMQFENSPVTVGNDLGNNAPLSALGGAGTIDGGTGGVATFNADHVTNSNSINNSGGNGGSGTGGDGGVVDMQSGSVPTDNTGAVTVNGGTGGTSNGTDGVFAKDGVVQ